MIAYRSIFFLIGILLSILACAMLLPLFAELIVYEFGEWPSFLASVFVTGFVGSCLSLANRPHGPIRLGVREAFILTTMSWVLSACFASLPFYFASMELQFIDALFESFSAITTTGATVLSNLQDMPRGILLWRALLQWLGGTGIILMAMTVLPILSIGGMQLFRSEFSDKSEKILPRVSQIASAIFTIYLTLTIACAVLYYFAGMGIFDAVCHSLTTVSTGGMANYDASLRAFDSLAVEIIAIVFMTIGSITLILWVRIWQNDWQVIMHDSQLRVFMFLLVMVSLGLSMWHWLVNGIDFWQSLRQASFSVVSIFTTCGYTTVDYVQWGSLPVILMLMLSSVGGCTGSTTGAIKIFRFQVLFSLAITHLRKLRRSHGVYIPLYNGQKITEQVAMSVFTFVTLYIMSLMVAAMVLALMDMDTISSMSAATACLGNIGPGITADMGPSGNYANISDNAKGLLMFLMVIGRLELLTVMTLFMPSFWRS